MRRFTRKKYTRSEKVTKAKRAFGGGGADKNMFSLPP